MAAGRAEHVKGTRVCERPRRERSVTELVLEVMADGERRGLAGIRDACNARRGKGDPEVVSVGRALFDLCKQGKLRKAGKDGKGGALYAAGFEEDFPELRW